jgi:hypothetical protein
MAGFIPAIHVLGMLQQDRKGVDGRDKPGHDDRVWDIARSYRPTPLPGKSIQRPPSLNSHERMPP